MKSTFVYGIIIPYPLIAVTDIGGDAYISNILHSAVKSNEL